MNINPRFVELPPLLIVGIREALTEESMNAIPALWQKFGPFINHIPHQKNAAAYGLCEDDIDMLELASPMHDIGKIAIPDAILNKPGKLTNEEFEIIKTHTQKGHDMLGISNRPLFKVASQIALTHHEKYDGTGYPNSLKGDDIPIFGRITALADVFDAIGSDRCYKKAWEMEKVLEFIKEQRGKHFDPKLVDIFFDNLDDILKIKEEVTISKSSEI